MPNADNFDRHQALRDFLTENEIPERYCAIMQSIILLIADHPKYTLEDACQIYAEQNQIPVDVVFRAVRNAVYSGWENAVSPVSILYSRRMSPADFVECAVNRLKHFR